MRAPPLTTDERIEHLSRELAEQMADAMIWHVSIELPRGGRLVVVREIPRARVDVTVNGFIRL